MIVLILIPFLGCKAEPSFELEFKLNNEDTISFRLQSNDSIPIEYANIVYLKYKKGSYSNRKGIVIIPKILGDSILVSSLGYRDTILKVSSQLENANITLSPKISTLPDVVVSNFIKLNSFYESGNCDFNSKNYCINKYGSQVGILVNGKAKKSIINEVSIKHIKTKYETFLRVRFLNSLNGFPNEEIFDTSFILKVEKNSKMTTLNLQNQNLIVSNDFFVVIDFLGKQEFINGEYLSYYSQPVEPFLLLTEKEMQEKTFLNYLSKKWSKYFVVNDPKGIRTVTNAIICCKLQDTK